MHKILKIGDFAVAPLTLFMVYGLVRVIGEVFEIGVFDELLFGFTEEAEKVASVVG